MQTVHVRVNDAATGQPTACQVRFTDAAGKYYAPLGRCSHQFPSNLRSFAEGNVYDSLTAWAIIDGACEIQLPPGPIWVAIHKGFEFIPLNTTIDLLPGKLAMRFTLERWADWRQQGWYAGDGRVHNASPHEVLLQAAAEDLAVVNLLAGVSDSGTMPNIVAFSGQKPCLEMPGHMVVVNTHNVHPDLGSLALLNCHRVVYPLRLGCPGEEDWTLADWCDQCHRKQGLVVWAEDQRNPAKTEALADLVLGKVDAFELTGQSAAERLAVWYSLLNAGFHVPLIGSSGARTNSDILGRPRTYCQLGPGEPLTYRNWIEAVRAGRTFVTEGPLLQFTVNGQPLGSVIDLSDQDKTVAVHAEVHSLLPPGNLEILCNGEVVGQVSANKEQLGANPEYTWKAELKKDVPIPDGGWLAAQVNGPSAPLARSSPIYISVAGREPPQRQPARRSLVESLSSHLNKVQKNRPGNERLEHVLQNACAKLAGGG